MKPIPAKYDPDNVDTLESALWSPEWSVLPPLSSSMPRDKPTSSRLRLSVLPAFVPFILSRSDFDVSFATNITAMYFVSVAFLPFLRLSESPAITNICSIAAYSLSRKAGTPSYGPSKSGGMFGLFLLSFDYLPSCGGERERERRRERRRKRNETEG